MKRGYIEHRLTYDINKTLGKNPKDMSSAQDRSVICANMHIYNKSATLDIKVTSFTLYIYHHVRPRSVSN